MNRPSTIECRPAQPDDAPAYRSYVTECGEAGLPLYQVAQFDPDGWLQSLLDHAEGRHLPMGYLPTTTYFALEEGEILGTLRLRHGDNPATAQWLGHIGYDTRPSRRGEGVARTLLRWLQQHVLTGPVLISCDETNAASLKIIEAANGQWLDRRYHAGDDCWVRFYRLPPLR
ncbi:GNAT family N-acetyltransferase [Aeromonas salmonicida]|uniref:GNAT family N-acetyltransferase n=1 Tax=Aeromonas salmonicida TaxID=645 RepID=UPI000BB666A8|nr:GNAT family N-acetyltransferase [Aeromonas salmonicida]PBO08058.1 GNAT family N-acetyltransferase [Aeromonas salmonicida]